MHRSEIIRFRCCNSCPETRRVSEQQRPTARPRPASAPRHLRWQTSDGYRENRGPAPTREESERPSPNFPWLEACSQGWSLPEQPAPCWLPTPQAAPTHQRVSFPDFHQPLQDSCQVRIVRLHRPDGGNSWVRLLERRGRRFSCCHCPRPTDAASRAGSCSPTAPQDRSLWTPESSITAP